MFTSGNSNQPQTQSTNQNSLIDSILNTPVPKVKVIVRKRPLNSKELSKKEADIISVKNNKSVIVKEEKLQLDLTKYISEKEFIFDNAYDEFSNNQTIYGENIRPMIFKAFYSKTHVTCFAFGQTGSGKTFTMMGSQNGNGNLGMYILAGFDIFQILSYENKFNGFSVMASFYEIYCDKLFDLLNNKNKLDVREDKNHNINVIGLSEIEIHFFDELMNLINKGLSNRTVGKTGANSDSSRSHGVIQLKILNKEKKEHGKITFIDLAGSEREADKVDINKKTRVDGAEINKSLLALKECIRALDAQNSHTPFRGCKLTLVLRDSFIGNCKILMIANISPTNNSADHTLNTLRYADTLKNTNFGQKMNKNKNNNNNLKSTGSNFYSKNNLSFNLNNTIGSVFGKESKNFNLNKTEKSISPIKPIKKSKDKKKRTGKTKNERNSSSSSNDSFQNNLCGNSKNNVLLNNNRNTFNLLSMPFQNSLNSLNNNNNLPNTNNLSNNFMSNPDENNNNKINNLFISNNNTNFNTYSLSLQNTENENKNNNIDIIQSNSKSSVTNLSFSASKLNDVNIAELEKRSDNIMEAIKNQDTLCMNNQQIHINTICESMKTVMNTINMYQSGNLEITSYIDSLQNIYKNQITQMNELNNGLEKLKNMVYHQVKLVNAIEDLKKANDPQNNLFYSQQLNNY